MSRATLVALAIGVLGAAIVLGLASSGTPVMPSYLAAWLFVLALPLGALPVVMGGEVLGLPETPFVALLRRLVAVMPLAAVLAIPVLLRLDGLYPALAAAKTGGPGWWMTERAVAIRAIVVLGLWTVLSAVFARPPGSARPPGAGFRGPRRTSLAGLGLALHAVMGAVAADDWVRAVEPGFVSAASGPLLIATQASVAVSLGVVMAVTRRRAPNAGEVLPVDVGIKLALLLGAWGFLVFTQYLVVWSANLPKEVAWYQHRAAGLGLAAESAAGLLCAAALVALLVRGLARQPRVVAAAAAALLVLHGLEMMWWVTPAFRSGFALTAADGAALVAAAGLGLGVALSIDQRSERGRGRHGEA